MQDWSAAARWQRLLGKPTSGRNRRAPVRDPDSRATYQRPPTPPSLTTTTTTSSPR